MSSRRLGRRVLMGTKMPRSSRVPIAISLIVAVFALTAACGDSSPEPTAPGLAVAQPTVELETPSVGSTPDPTAAPAPTTTSAADVMPEPTAHGLAAAQPTAELETPSVGSTPDPTAAPAPTATSAADAMPEPTEPPLINTPSPVSNIAPDFTLPSIEGVDYSLSQFRGDKSVAVVFYRGYW